MCCSVVRKDRCRPHVYLDVAERYGRRIKAAAVEEQVCGGRRGQVCGGGK